MPNINNKSASPRFALAPATCKNANKNNFNFLEYNINNKHSNDSIQLLKQPRQCYLNKFLNKEKLTETPNND